MSLGRSQIMWSHSHLMWSRAARYSQLIWSQNADVFGPGDLCSRAATARELRSDHFGDWDDCKLTYHRWRFELPLFVIRDIIGDAQQDGIAPANIKILFDSTCYETNAAVFDGLAQNPGGLFRAVFRRRCQKGTGRFQSVVRQPESQKIPRERTQICRTIKSVGSVKTATDTEHDDAYRIDIASKLKAFRLSMN
jgi:hypothetical protein